MKFTTSTSELQKQLQIINGAVGTNTTIPILEDFLFEVKNSQLTVVATDLETTMSVTLDVSTQGDGKIAIPAKILLDLLKTLPDQPLTFELNPDTNIITIKSQNGKYKVAGEPDDDFFQVPSLEGANQVVLKAAILSNAINKCMFAVSTDELRPSMTGVFFTLNEEGVTFVATDAHKLVRYRHSGQTSEESSSFIVPKKALGLLKAALPSDDTDITIAYDQADVFFSFHGTRLKCRLIDARYPDYNAVIPQENPYHLVINKKDFQSSLKRIAIFSNKTTYQVALKIEGNKLSLSAQDIDFSSEAREFLHCQYEGEDMEIAFNAKFLVEILNVMDGDEVALELSSPSRAGLIVPTVEIENEDLLMLVMPIMLNN
ncbi:MAG: DNA polymerase III subunit beta [Chitinophagales bacterium]